MTVSRQLRPYCGGFVQCSNFVPGLCSLCITAEFGHVPPVLAWGGPAIATAAPPVAAPLAGSARLGPAAWAWALFQGARDPYVILVIIYVFAPYFATVVVGDPVRGQALTASAAKWGGWAVLLIAPLVGATVDRMGRRKPLLGLVVACMVPLIAALWWVRPGGGIGVDGAVVILATMTVLLALTDTLHNALLLPAAGMRAAGSASGLALALGNFVSVFLLAFVLWAFALPGKVAWGWIPPQPLFGLDTATHEQDRVVALIAAGTLVVLGWPVFRYVPDVPSTGVRLGAAIRAGAGDLMRLLREAREHANALLFILTRMVFTDGLSGILVFTGIYAAGRMGWGALELLAYGILLSAVAVIGGLGAGWLDGRIGPKFALITELALAIASQIAVLGIGKDMVFYQPWDPAAHAPLWHGPMFTTVPELVFIAVGFVGALGVCGAYASSRTMLTRVAPPDRIGVFFGLFSLAGLATSWLAPALVQYATLASGSQRIGLLPVSGLLAAGLVMLLFVKGGGRVRA